jgi:hypothetical protein
MAGITINGSIDILIREPVAAKKEGPTIITMIKTIEIGIRKLCFEKN